MVTVLRESFQKGLAVQRFIFTCTPAGAESVVDRTKSREMNADAAERCEHRRMEEARGAVEILERLKKLGKQD